MSSVNDLLAHLRPLPVVLTFEGREYVIPAMDAVEWIVLVDGDRPDLYEIFPVLAGQDAVEHVEDALWEGRVDIDGVARLGLEAVGAAADRKWWVALNLIASAKTAWEFVHVNKAAGMSLAGWLDEVYSKIMVHIDPKKKAGWLSDIERVPKGWEGEINYTDEEQAFLSAMNAVMKR